MPFGPSDLLDWMSNRNGPTKLAIGGWMLTMFGFMFAFLTTSATWRRHKEFELRIEAAKEIHNRFQKAFTKLLSINTYLHLLSLAVDNSRKLLADDPVATWHLAFPNSAGPSFTTQRAELDVAIMEVSDLRAAYSTIFDNVSGVKEAIIKAENALNATQQAFWRINAPHGEPATPRFVPDFLAQYDSAPFRATLLEAVEAHRIASTLSGFARGRLLKGVVPANAFALWQLSRNVRSMAQALQDMKARPGK